MKKVVLLLIVLIIPFSVHADNLYFNINYINVGDIYFNGDNFIFNHYPVFTDDNINITYYDENNNEIGTQRITDNGMPVAGPIHESWIVTDVETDYENDEKYIKVKGYNKPNNIHIYDYEDFVDYGDYFNAHLTYKYLLHPGDIIRVGTKEGGHLHGAYYFANDCVDNDCTYYYYGSTQYENDIYGNHFGVDSSRTKYYYMGFEDRFSAGIYLPLYEYEAPELTIECDKQSVKSNDVVNCSLYCSKLTNYDNFQFNLSSEKMSLFNVKSKYVFDSLGNNNYSFETDNEFFIPKDTDDEDAYEEYKSKKALLLQFQMKLNDGYEELDNITVAVSSKKNYLNEDPPSAYYVLNKTDDFVEPEIKGVETNPKTDADNTYKYIIYTIVSVLLFVIFILLDKKKVFKKI